MKCYLYIKKIFESLRFGGISNFHIKEVQPVQQKDETAQHWQQPSSPC